MFFSRPNTPPSWIDHKSSRRSRGFSALEANARNLISHLFDDNDFGLAALPALVILPIVAAGVDIGKLVSGVRKAASDSDSLFNLNPTRARLNGANQSRSAEHRRRQFAHGGDDMVTGELVYTDENGDLRASDGVTFSGRGSGSRGRHRLRVDSRAVPASPVYAWARLL